MQKLKDYTKERAKKVIFADKLVNPSQYKQALKLEVYAVLSQFANISLEDIKLAVVVNEDNTYKINISANASVIKPVGNLLS